MVHLTAHAQLSPEEERSLIEYLQDFLQDGVVVVIGSGFSAKYGMPVMSALATHLQVKVPGSINPSSMADKAAWALIDAELQNGSSLETALQVTNIPSELLDIVVRESATFIDSTETEVIRAIACGASVPPLGRIVQHILKASRQLHIVTTNYDRLIECQLEKSLIPLDTGYVGAYVAFYDSDRSALAHKEYINESKRVRSVHHPHAYVSKPHGSLDWYIDGEKVIRCAERLQLPRAIITPGLTKYRSGYSPHYEEQRSTAIKALEKATRVLVIGYGFNDDQLEHRWCPNLKTAKRIVILTKVLTPNATELVKASTGAYALCEDPSDFSKTLIFQGPAPPKVCSKKLWDIEDFTKEVIR